MLEELQARLGRRETVVLLTAVATEGSPPCRPGQKLLANAVGALAGTLGCSELDRAAEAHASQVASGADPGLVWLDHEAGRVQAYLELFEPAPRLVILSATPVAQWLARWAPDVGWEAVTVDDRHERDAELDAAGQTLASSITDVAISAADAVVATDHDAPGLERALEAALRSEAGFVGVMGSRRHAGPHLDRLRQKGFSDDEVGRIESPVGLDLGGRSAPEIALSILAGVVANRYGRSGGPLRAAKADHVGPTP